MATIETPMVGAPARARRKRSRWGTVLKVAGAGLLLLMVVLAAIVVVVVRRPLATTGGTLPLAGLAAPVTVVRDHSGIPHITGATTADVLRAQGYVMAQDRLFEMDLFRRAASGRLAEALSASLVDTDRLFRTLGLRRVAEQELAALPAEHQDQLQHFADGVNAFLSSHQDTLPLEFTVLGYKPDPWTPVDTIAIGKLQAWDLSENMDIELLMADLQARLGPERAAALFPAYPDGKTTIVRQSALPGNPNRQAGMAWRSGLLGESGGDGLIGSNNWVIDGSRAADGKPLLANDPHLTVRNPSIWYAMHLRAQDGSLEVEGVTLPGSPGIVIGHNRDIVWGVTNLGPDTQDFFVERLDEAAHPGQYEYQGQWLPLTIVNETIKVKGEADVNLAVRSTHHGPLMNDVLDGLSAPTSLQWTALQPGGLLKAVFNLDRAANWEAFRAALSTWDVPGQNFVYADTAGNIGYQATGQWPIRAAGNGLVPVAGWTGANEWTGFVPFAAMPTVYNPPEHFIVTANNRVVGPDYPHLVTGYWFPWFRAERITQMIEAKDKLTMDDFKAMQYDTLNLRAVALGKHLAALQGGDARSRQAVALFQNWDGNIAADSATAALYEITAHQVHTNTFADELGESLTARYRGGTADTVIFGLLDDPTNAWWDDMTTPAKETRDDILRRSLDAAVAALSTRLGADMSKWSWGALHTITFDHPLGTVQPLNKLYNFGPFPMPGDNFTVAAAGYNAAYAQRSHASMRMITSPGDWGTAQLIFAPGQSGQLADTHWGDLVADYLAGRYRTLPWTDAQIQQAAEATLTLQP